MPELAFFRHGEELLRVALADQTTIGRSADCDVSLPDPGLSRVQAVGRAPRRRLHAPRPVRPGHPGRRRRRDRGGADRRHRARLRHLARPLPRVGLRRPRGHLGAAGSPESARSSRSRGAPRPGCASATAAASASSPSPTRGSRWARCPATGSSSTTPSSPRRHLRIERPGRPLGAHRRRLHQRHAARRGAGLARRAPARAAHHGGGQRARPGDGHAAGRGGSPAATRGCSRSTRACARSSTSSTGSPRPRPPSPSSARPAPARSSWPGRSTPAPRARAARSSR